MSKTTNTLFDVNELNESKPQSNQDKKMEMMLKDAFSKKNIEMKSELTQNQINAITKLQMHSREFNCKFTGNLAKHFMVLQVSKGRKGRTEYTDIAKSFSVDPEEAGGIRKQLLGGE